MIDRVALALSQAVSPAAQPTPSGVDENLVTPGPAGFIIIFLIGVVVVLLIIDMVRRIRRVNYRAEIQERLEAEKRARDDDGAQ